MGNDVKEIDNIIKAEGKTKVDVEEESKNTSQGKIITNREEIVKVKELEKINVDTKVVDNINDKIELANVNESTNTKVKDEGMEINSIDSKDEIKSNNEGDSNISLKSRSTNIINQENTSTIV